ncbi:retrovirus-related pol polyprotein from transposon TNT 1-94 [Tanacetum coccineum]
MDSVILLGQKNTLAEYMILSGADNRPPMLDKDLYDSWKSRMELYMQNREHRRMILESVENGPLIWPTVEENGTEDLNTYDSNCDDISNAQAVLMANISNYGSDVISEFRISNPTIESSNPPPVKVEVPSELPKVSLVNASLKRLKFHLDQFDSVVKNMTTHDARTEGEWGFEHTKPVFNNEIIPFLKSLTNIFNVFNRDLLNEIMEVQTVFNQMDDAVQQFSVDKQCLEIAKKELFLENDRLLQQIMSQDVLLTVMNSMSLIEFFEYNDLKAQLQDKDSTICNLTDIIKSLREKSKEENVNYDYCEIETKNVELMNSVEKLLSENKRLCNELNHVKQGFKEQFDSIKKTRVHTKERSDSLIDKLNLKSAENEDLKAQIQDKVFVITSLKNDLRKIKGKEIVDIAAQIPSADTIVPVLFKLDLEPLAPRLLQNRDVHIKYLKYAQEQADILRGIVESSKTSDSNTPVLSSTGLKCSTSKCRSKPTGNKKNDRISRPSSRNMKNKVEAQPKKVNKKNRVVEPICDVDVKHSLLNVNSEPIYATCKKSMFDSVHDMCLLDFMENVNSRAKSAKKHKKQNIWKPTGNVLTEVGLKWKPTGRTFTIVDIPSSSSLVMTGCPDYSLVSGLRIFENDHIVRIMGYGDYQLGNATISRVYYVEGLGHNLFFVGQFCDGDLEVAFWKNTCFIHNLEDLLSESRDTNLYIISLDDMLKTSPICLLSKASKAKIWLWHCRLSHLNFGTINKLAKEGLARGIPRLNFQKDHSCSACALGKSKKSSHQPKAEDTNQEKLYLLHMDLCGPTRVASINGKRYILMIVDDYSRFTWVRFLRTKDEAPKAIMKCIKNIQVHLNATVRNVRTDNGTEFIN